MVADKMIDLELMKYFMTDEEEYTQEDKDKYGTDQLADKIKDALFWFTFNCVRGSNETWFSLMNVKKETNKIYQRPYVFDHVMKSDMALTEWVILISMEKLLKEQDNNWVKAEEDSKPGKSKGQQHQSIKDMKVYIKCYNKYHKSFQIFSNLFIKL